MGERHDQVLAAQSAYYTSSKQGWTRRDLVMNQMPGPVSTLPAVRLLGSLRTSPTFLFILLFVIAGASTYLWTLRDRSYAMAVEAGLREVQATVEGAQLSIDEMKAGTVVVRGDTRLRILNNISIPSDLDLNEFERNALTQLRDNSSAVIYSPWPTSQPTHLRYAAVLPDGRVTLANHSLAAMSQTLNRHLVRTYLFVGILMFLFVGSFSWLTYATRKELIELETKFDPAHAATLEKLKHRNPLGDRRSRIVWIVLLTLPVFVLDYRYSITSLAGAVYVVAVMLSLSSSRPWHAIVAAVWTLLLLFLAPILAPPIDDLWQSLSTHALIAFFIIATTAFGLTLRRRTYNESLAITQAAQANQESEQLRSALARVEAADARMRGALERLTLATRYAGVSVWEWDLDADTIYAAEGSDFGQRLGSTTHMRGGDFVRNYVYVDDREAFADAFGQALKTKTTDSQLDHRYRCVTADGSLQHIQLRARVYRDANGEPTRIVGVDWNVTREIEAAQELHRQAEQLRDAERRLERASLSSLEGHWETDLLTGHSWVSSSLSALLGFAPGEFEALHVAVTELAHEDDLARNEAAYLSHIERGTEYDLQLRLRNAHGEYRWCRLQGAAERDGGHPVRISGSVQDIHRQKEAEVALHDARQRFVRAVTGAQDGLFDYDLVRDTTWFSPRCQRMLGYDDGNLDITFSQLMDYVHPEDVEQVRSVFRAHVQHREPYDVEYRLQRQNGDWLWVRSRAVAEFDNSGKPLRLSGSVQDITEARAAREELVRATKAAEAANAAKSTFLATMSHEIRTPMNGIIGMTGLLLDTHLDRTQREYASTIRSSADALLYVINDVLDFSKIEAGKLDIDMADMDLRASVEDVCALMALQAAAKGVELVVDLRPEVPDLVRGDAQRIRQCLLNLLGNAVKFTQRGEIIVEVCVLAQQSGKALTQFTIRDTGIGLTDEQRLQLFRPFVQADSSTTRQFGGTGLGLSIVKRLIELMGGQVGVESELNAGSTFWFTLPLEAIEPTGRYERLRSVGSNQRVLVVDDNEANRKVLGAQLDRAGFDAELAADATQALETMRAAHAAGKPFDAALLDFQMPAMDGASLGEVINADSQLASTRLVLLTSMDRTGDQQRFAAIGFAAYLTKPVRGRELKECLERVLARPASEWHMRSQPLVTRNVLADALGEPTYGGLVLLVEDNEVNQKVAQKYLERLGCHVRTADDGAAGVQAFKEDRFDLILMDMQMPIMDGIAATREIRKLERGGRHTPIVALTANVLAGQLERCLEAGMDDFLTKPLDVARLRDVLDRFGLHAADWDENVRSSSAASPTTNEATPLDWRRIDEVADGDNDFANELVATFLDSAREALDEASAAWQQHDRAALARAAHKLKGASGNVGAHRMQSLSLALETDADQGSVESIESALAALLTEEASVRMYVQQRNL
jgi:two-component system sensor histidine kinase/response regulator